MSEILSKISSAVITGNVGEMVGLTRAALDEGLSPKEILDNGLMPGMDYVGEQFRKGEMYVPEVLLSARAMQASMDIVKPLLAETGAQMVGKAVLGTVKGDLHDIGKNLVGMMLEGAGFEVIDLGKNVAPEQFLEAIKKEKPDIVGMSALLTTTMRSMAATIKVLEEAGVRDQVKVMVGGAPVTSDYAEQIGADGYASNAPAAAEMARKFVGVV
ncbi:MAG TPA: cobalamin-binding protein [Anaerolineae bacterium]|nr:cobalamin-binding protein [Anaerolineae bacterium]